MNEDTLRDMSDDALFYGRHRDDDKDLGCSEINPLTHWDEVLAASNMTQEDYDRQCDDLIQMERDYRRDLKIYRETGVWPL